MALDMLQGITRLTEVYLGVQELTNQRLNHGTAKIQNPLGSYSLSFEKTFHSKRHITLDVPFPDVTVLVILPESFYHIGGKSSLCFVCFLICKYRTNFK